MRNKLVINLMLFIVACSQLGFAQRDTLIVITPSFQPVKKIFPVSYFSQGDSILLVTKSSLQVMDTSLAAIAIDKNNYCIFIDKKGRRIQEGKWDGENYDGLNILYYKNGNTKEKGDYWGRVKTNNWFYYNKKGELIMEELWDKGELIERKKIKQ